MVPFGYGRTGGTDRLGNGGTGGSGFVLIGDGIGGRGTGGDLMGGGAPGGAVGPGAVDDCPGAGAADGPPPDLAGRDWFGDDDRAGAPGRRAVLPGAFLRLAGRAGGPADGAVTLLAGPTAGYEPVWLW
ncbi:MAG: hypothetical protein ACRDVG_13445 [Jatrophihabitantaceae bacterium]